MKTLKKCLIVLFVTIFTATANSSICCPQFCCGDFFAQFDSLYWTSCAHGLMYGSETHHTELITPNSSLSDFNTKIKNPHQKWDVGYRLGLGYRSPCECYDIGLFWINYQNTAHGHVDIPVINGAHWFTPAWGIVSPLLGGNTINGDNPLNVASANWKLRLNLIDLVIGRPFCVNSCLSLKPYIGARAAIFDQHYHIRHYASINGSLEETPGVREKFSLKTRFEGAGLRIGMESEYNLGCGLFLYGDLAASLLWGREKISTGCKFRSAPTDETGLVDILMSEEECAGQAITDAAIGIRWLTCCCNKVLILELGWEHHYFFSTNKFEKTVFNGDNPSGFPAINRYPQDIHGDLSVQGLVSNMRVLF